MTGSELHRKFPQFATNDDYVAVYQPDAGLVDAALGNAVHIQLARAHGATILDNCGVQKIERNEDGKLTVSLRLTPI